MKIIINQFKDHNARPQGKQSQWVEKSISCFFHMPILKWSLFSNFVIINPSIYSSLEEMFSSLSELGFKSVNGVYLDVIGKWQVFSLGDHLYHNGHLRATLSAQLRREWVCLWCFSDYFPFFFPHLSHLHKHMAYTFLAFRINSSMNGHLNYHQLFYLYCEHGKTLYPWLGYLNFCPGGFDGLLSKKVQTTELIFFARSLLETEKKHCLYVLINSLTFISVLILAQKKLSILNSIYRI